LTKYLIEKRKVKIKNSRIKILKKVVKNKLNLFENIWGTKVFGKVW
jgi:hypothetical protein